MLAPICGVPAVSRTTPASLPSTGLACAAAGLIAKEETAAARTRAQDSELPLFHVLYLPGAVLAVVLASGAAFTVKSAVREMV